jgi:hypothetical protein
MADLLTKCQMCQVFDMEPAKSEGGDHPDYVMCPNCDDPDGENPPITSV